MCALLRLLRLKPCELVQLGFGFFGQGLHAGQILAQGFDELRACLRYIAEVVHLAPELVGVLAIEQQTQRFRLSGQVLPIEEIGEQLLMAFHAACELRFAGTDILQSGAHVSILAGQLEQAAICSADRALRFFERVCCKGSGLFRFGELLLQRLDAGTQFLQFIRRTRTGRARCCQQHEQQQPAQRRFPHSDAAGHLARCLAL